VAKVIFKIVKEFDPETEEATFMCSDCKRPVKNHETGTHMAEYHPDNTDGFVVNFG